MKSSARVLICVSALGLLLGFIGCQQPAPPVEQAESAADKAAKVAEANKATAMKFMNEVVSQGNLAALDEIVATDFVEHQEVPPGTPGGIEGLRGFITAYRAAFPDASVSVEQIVASDDLVAVRSIWKGTHKGEWMGVAPTGKALEFQVLDFVRVKDGKAVEHWGMDNTMQVLTAAQKK
jgi:steroid delta-isomerase-like uncharacterized protein